MSAGRPRKYETEDELIAAVDSYFEHIKGEKQLQAGEGGVMQEVWVRFPEPGTITGLMLHLGFESRQSFYDYEKDGTFSYTIKSARLRVEHEYEKRLTTAPSATGAIFALKNLGWVDKVETGFTNREGEDQTVQIFQLPHNNRDNPNPAT